MSQAVALIAVDPERRHDEHYRYKMPTIVTKVEGNGNGIKTVFPNITDVAAAVGRPAEILNKFFGSELGALANYIKADEKYLIMGSFQRDIIQERVYAFIKKYVLCTKCRNPETTLSLKKKSVISTCASCGHKAELLTDRTVQLLYSYLEQNPTATAGAAIRNPTKQGDADAEVEADKKKRKKDRGGADGQRDGDDGSGPAAAGSTLMADDKNVVEGMAANEDPRHVVVAALRAADQSKEDRENAATAVLHQRKQSLALSPSQVIQTALESVFLFAADDNKPLGALMQYAGFIRNFREVGPNAPQDILAELEHEFVKKRESPEKMAMAVVLLLDEDVLLRGDLDVYKAALERKETKALEKAKGVPPAEKSRQRLVLEALEPIFTWTQLTQAR